MSIDVEELKSAWGHPLFRVGEYLYCVDKSKGERLYCRCIRGKSDNCGARAIVDKVDFEIAVLRAIEEIFPMAEIRGCNFHFTQALWRKVQHEGLSGLYGSDPALERYIKGVMALSLVPLHRLDDAWLEVEAESPGVGFVGHEKLVRFKDYFIRTWMDNDTIFPRSLWNHHGNLGVRTTNHLEGWHSSLNKKIKSAHVNIYELISHLKKEEHDQRLQRVLLDAGNPPRPPKRKYKILND
ncbi:uncharacterized protein LOC108864695 [Galendromus occidentalis]|uniref:Uncharacterized protein LOC108864695 n=1 Tax=Galendromus occidentalis TaxID=34638 RepID=A0AAJ7PAG8_9ACAR|nr:uncharacterized protein LOC108864695 [Galendromus occidentalis]